MEGLFRAASPEVGNYEGQEASDQCHNSDLGKFPPHCLHLYPPPLGEGQI